MGDAPGEDAAEDDASPEERKFLGFSITNDGSQRQIAPKALERFKMRVRDLTRRTRGVSVPQLIEPLARYLVGWRAYLCRRSEPEERTSAHHGAPSTGRPASFQAPTPPSRIPAFWKPLAW